MILSLLTSTALGAGLLYSGDDNVPLAAYDARVEVTGRIQEVTATFSFPAPGEGARRFAAVLPEDAAVTGLRVREGGGDWIVAAATAASELNTDPGPWGDPVELLEGQVFVASLPDLSGEDLEVALDWQRLLAAEGGALSLTVPLDDGGLNGSDPPVTVRLHVEDDALGAASLSPEGALSATDTVIDAAWSGALSEADAVALRWEIPAPELGVRLWAYRPAIDPFTGVAADAGYALVAIQPGAGAEARVDQIFSFVLDTSASMDGEALEAAVAAGSAWLDTLAESDRFNLIPYQSIALPFRAKAPLADDAAVAKGKAFLARQRARGLSDPGEALTEALSLEQDTILQEGLFSCGGTARGSDTAPPLPDAEVRALDGAPGPAAYVVWLTDGGASVGETDPLAIAEAVAAANAPGASVYALGLGPDADMDLLALVTAANRGEAQQAGTVAEVAGAVAALQDRVAHPLLVRPAVAVAGAWDQAPASLQDASEGYELLLAFRWDEPGEATLRLTGVRGLDDLDESFGLELPELDESLPAVARAWAQLRVHDLDARYKAGDTGVYGEIQSLVETWGVASEVVTLSYGAEDAGDYALAYDQAGGCGCGLGLRARAALSPALLIGLAVLRRRRAARA